MCEREVDDDDKDGKRKANDILLSWRFSEFLNSLINHNNFYWDIGIGMIYVHFFTVNVKLWGDIFRLGYKSNPYHFILYLLSEFTLFW